MAHAPEHTSIRAGNSLYRICRSIEIVPAVHRHIALRIGILEGYLSIRSERMDEIIISDEPALSMAYGHKADLTRSEA